MSDVRLSWQSIDDGKRHAYAGAYSVCGARGLQVIDRNSIPCEKCLQTLVDFQRAAWSEDADEE